jgi:hypothetical protein
MQLDWQTILALAIVAGAAVVLARRAQRLLAGRGKGGCQAGCGGCANESTGTGMKRRPVVELPLDDALPSGQRLNGRSPGGG